MRTVEVVPLPRVHAQDVGAPVVVSAMVTDNGATPEATEVVKLATGTPDAGAVTVMVWETGALAPLALLAVNVTVYVPAALYLTNGYWVVEVVPFPRSHAQDVGGPVEVSVSSTHMGAIPVVGVAVKLATGAPAAGAVTVMVLDTGALAPPALLAVNVTV